MQFGTIDIYDRSDWFDHGTFPPYFYATSIATHQKSVEHWPGDIIRQLVGSTRTDHESGDSSRALLTTVLGEFVLPHERASWTQSLVAVLNDFDITDKATRQAIARLGDQDWLKNDRVGRQTRWRLTDLSSSLLTDGAERIYQFGQVARPWDGQWLVLLARIPEPDRNRRYRLGVGLRWAGFGSLGQGVWISPWTEREHQASLLTQELAISSATTFTATLGELGSGPSLVDQAWDLDALRRSYEAFLHDTESLTKEPTHLEPGTPTAHVATLTALVHRWRRFPALDPDLPASLLPADWPGPDAAKRFAKLRRSLVDPARQEWQDLEASYTPRRSPRQSG